jgi:hypothetical protein
MVSIAQTAVDDPVREATAVVRTALLGMVVGAIRRAELCGCRSCYGQAVELTDWTHDLLHGTHAPQS